MSELRNRADAVLVGGNSFRATPLPLLPKAEHLSEPLRSLPYLNVVVSRKMNFTLSERYLREKKITPLFLTAKNRAPTRFPCDVIACPDGDPTPAWIVKVLAERGVKTLLVEAGGDLIYQFLAADLIDDMYITLCPKIIGARGAPALADGDGFGADALKTLALRDCRVVADEVFLHYERRGAKQSA